MGATAGTAALPDTIDITGKSIDELDVYSLSAEHQRVVTRLLARRNRLQELPAEIGLFQQLQDVSLRENRFVQFPRVLCQLERLAKLSLARCALMELPDDWGKLGSSLQILVLGYNELTALPESIGQLRALRSLDVQHNRIGKLPESIGQLSMLRELLVQRNQLTSLPESCRHLQELQILNLSENRLSDFPTVLLQLLQLRDVYLSSNQLQSIPPHVFTAWSQLQTWEVHSNRLTHIPPEITGVASTLRRLNYSLNILTRIPKEIGELTKVQWFNINGNAIEALPATIGQMRVLQKLGLAKNQLRQLPNEIATLYQLDKLDVRGNQLTALLPTVQFMRHTTIWYAGNPLTKVLGRQTTAVGTHPYGQAHSLLELTLRSVLNTHLRHHLTASVTNISERSQHGDTKTPLLADDDDHEEDAPPSITNEHVLRLPIPTHLQRLLSRPKICNLCLAPYVTEHFSYVEEATLPGLTGLSRMMATVPVRYQVCSERCVERLEGRRPFDAKEICLSGMRGARIAPVEDNVPSQSNNNNHNMAQLLQSAANALRPAYAPLPLPQTFGRTVVPSEDPSASPASTRRPLLLAPRMQPSLGLNPTSTTTAPPPADPWSLRGFALFSFLGGSTSVINNPPTVDDHMASIDDQNNNNEGVLRRMRGFMLSRPGDEDRGDQPATAGPGETVF